MKFSDLNITNKKNSGGFSEIFEADDPNSGTIVIKQLRFGTDIVTLEDKEKLWKRFQREVRFQKAQDSATVLPVLFGNLNEDPPWFAMPLAERDFRKEIEDCKAQSTIPVEALADILNCLESLHDAGFTHRDLKPENILLHEGVWKLSDFGLILPPEGDETKLTGFSTNIGTPEYCAPEQRSEFRNAKGTVDVYAFGCVLHDLFGKNKRIPFNEYTADGPIGRVIEKCTHISPIKRFQNVRSLRSALLNILARSQTTVVSNPDTEDVIAKIQTATSWTEDDDYEFKGFLSRIHKNDQESAFFKDVDNDMITKLFNLSETSFSLLGERYSDWAHGDFIFAYVDVVASRLEQIFNLGDLGCKSQAALALARLGAKHNRWFVGRVLVKLLNPKIGTILAEHIATEIMLEDRRSDFLHCVNMNSMVPDHYHQIISKEIQGLGPQSKW